MSAERYRLENIRKMSHVDLMAEYFELVGGKEPADFYDYVNMMLLRAEILDRMAHGKSRSL